MLLAFVDVIHRQHQRFRRKIGIRAVAFDLCRRAIRPGVVDRAVLCDGNVATLDGLELQIKAPGINAPSAIPLATLSRADR